ncbi:MAG: amylo-alpha-1,6-glucosidase, partial [Pirellulaceae bacterium]|nr:amylo-alpha-1,6-glucosidase [Pirellulaceae bacterium]
MATVRNPSNGVPQTMADLDITHRIDVCGDPLAMSEREWLLTNGTGAYAMGTVPAINTRRYHGLFIAASHPPVGRVMALNQILEQLRYSDHDEVLQFTACQFQDHTGQDVFEPTGFTALKRFEKGTRVVWHYEHDGLFFSRQLTLQWHQQAATLLYRIDGLRRPAHFSVSPMLTLRDFHELLHRGSAAPFRVEVAEACVTVRHRDVAATYYCPQARFIEEPDWWYAMYYRSETERGQSDREDCFLPGRFEVEVQVGSSTEVQLTIAWGDQAAKPVPGADSRQQHLTPVLAHLHDLDCSRQIRSSLAIAADDFVVQRPIGDQILSTILAGYPWFADWGRDTFISLPALLLCTGRFDEARATLAAFAGAIREGMVPNRFDDHDRHAAHYNTADASLWFVHAAITYRHVTGDRAAWDDWIAGAIKKIVHAYLNGTPADPRAPQRIKVDQDGLVDAGSRHTQLTWMDAMTNGVAHTPRHGKAVEINSLWYHVLVALVELTADSDPEEADQFKDLAARVKRAFNRVFWDEQLGYLRDHV